MGIPTGYSIKHWDPTEAPIILLGSVFDANSLGKWIYDWTVYHHGGATPTADMAGDFWLLLIRLAGKMKWAEECVPRIRNMDNKEMVEDFIESGSRMWGKLKKLLRSCEPYMWRAANREVNEEEVKEEEGKEGEVKGGEAKEGGAREGEAREGEAREGEVREGEAREGEVREGEAREGEAREGEAREGGPIEEDGKVKVKDREIIEREVKKGDGKEGEGETRKRNQKKGVSMGKNAGTEFVEAIFGRDRELENTENLMTTIRLWTMRFDANCEEILRRPSAA